MRKYPVINENNIVEELDAKFIRVYDYQYAPGRHYYNSTRRQFEDLMILKDIDECRNALPDAVTCLVVLITPDDEPRVLMLKEYRYPIGQYLMSPPAGVLDPSDRACDDPVLTAARREIYEETGISLSDKDRLFIINPLLFSSPGLTDESNACACAVVHLEDLSILNQNGAEDTELFDGFRLLTKDEAKTIIRNGRDEEGLFYSVFTQIVLQYFVQDRWMEE